MPGGGSSGASIQSIPSTGMEANDSGTMTDVTSLIQLLERFLVGRRTRRGVRGAMDCHRPSDMTLVHSRHICRSDIFLNLAGDEDPHLSQSLRQGSCCR